MEGYAWFKWNVSFEILLFILLLAIFVPATLIFLFTAIYASLYSLESDLNVEVLKLIFWLK